MIDSVHHHPLFMWDQECPREFCVGPTYALFVHKRYWQKHQSANWPFQDTGESLQQDLKTLVRWAYKWQMLFNAKKHIALVIIRVCTWNINLQLNTREPLEAVVHHKYLGVELSTELNWNVRIAGITGKANISQWKLSKWLSCAMLKKRVTPELLLLLIYFALAHCLIQCILTEAHAQVHICCDGLCLLQITQLELE